MTAKREIDARRLAAKNIAWMRDWERTNHRSLAYSATEILRNARQSAERECTRQVRAGEISAARTAARAAQLIEEREKRAYRRAFGV